MTLILHLVPGAPEERLGVLEELPPAAGWFGSERLVRQARYRDRLTNEIVRVDRDTAVKRRRIRREMRAR